MKKIRRLPTLIAIGVVLVGIVGGIVLIDKAPEWFTKAEQSLVPQEVKVTNVANNSFTISWITEGPAISLVKYGVKKNKLDRVANDENDKVGGQNGKYTVHYVTLANLEPETGYYFKIDSGGNTYDHNGQAVKTGPEINTATTNDVAYGVVKKEDGSPGAGLIVYLNVANGVMQSCLTTSAGNWVVPLHLIRTADLTRYISYDKEASIEDIVVQGGKAGTATVVTIAKHDSPLPDIVLNHSYDYRTGVPDSQTGQTDEPNGLAGAQTSPTPTPTSRFGLPDEAQSTASANLKIVNPGSGEKVNTAKPDFYGTGPAGQEASIVVHSDETINAKIIIGKNGEWNWVPPANLSPGEHSITISAEGKSVTRSFMVLAAGETDIPAFTATPAGQLTGTPTPTKKLTPTATPTIGRAKVPATTSGIPTSGNLTPTVFVSIMGLGLILIGIFLYDRFKYYR